MERERIEKDRRRRAKGSLFLSNGKDGGVEGKRSQAQFRS